MYRQNENVCNKEINLKSINSCCDYLCHFHKCVMQFEIGRGKTRKYLRLQRNCKVIFNYARRGHGNALFPGDISQQRQKGKNVSETIR